MESREISLAESDDPIGAIRGLFLPGLIVLLALLLFVATRHAGQPHAVAADLNANGAVAERT